MSPKDNFTHTASGFQGTTRRNLQYSERVERSVALAKEVAGKLEIDLFDERRRGRFRQIVQNCTTCAYQNDCRKQVTEVQVLETTLPHCRNRVLFSRED